MNPETIRRMARETESSFETVESLFKFADRVATAEREECAKLFDGAVWSYDYREIAAVIRERRQPMINEQPEALELADRLERMWVGNRHAANTVDDAAYKLRRLHRVNAELLDALRAIDSDAARAAIAKAEAQ